MRLMKQAKQTKVYIYGKHAVTEALEHSSRVVKKVLLSPRIDFTHVRELAKRVGVPVEPLDPRKVTSYVEGNAPHQGIVASIAANEVEVSFDSFLETFIPNNDTLLVLLGEIQDPHNVGALIRSCAAFGASAVLLPTKKQASVTPAVAKASAGMAFRIPLVATPSIQEAIHGLKKKGVRVYGLAGEESHSIIDEPFRAPTLLVLGNEGGGLSSAIRKECDLLLSIPMHSRAESLNVAASGAVAMYAWSLKHQKALKRKVS